MSDVYADVEVGDLVFCLLVAVAAGLGVCAVELHHAGSGVLKLFLDECREVGGARRIVWESCAVFGVVQVVGREGGFGRWTTGFLVS